MNIHFLSSRSLHCPLRISFKWQVLAKDCGAPCVPLIYTQFPIATLTNLAILLLPSVLVVQYREEKAIFTFQNISFFYPFTFFFLLWRHRGSSRVWPSWPTEWHFGSRCGFESNSRIGWLKIFCWSPSVAFKRSAISTFLNEHMHAHSCGRPSQTRSTLQSLEKGQYSLD